MESKIMNIFYGADNLPYKDQPRTVHFPIVGQAFMGASNTTEIRFYTDKIGSIDATYISIAKLPNGKVGTKILTKGYDAQIDENYVSLKLSNFYTQAKGDLYISLNGYEGGVELIYNKDTGLYEIYGTPTIQATGSVKIAINYATQYVGDGTEETITLQEIYALFGNKLDKDSPYYIKAIDDISDINRPILAPYLKGNQIVYSKSDNVFYRIVENEGTLSATKLPSAVDCLKLDGSTPMQGNLDLANHNISNVNDIASNSVSSTSLSVDSITSKSGGDVNVAKDINMQGNKIKNVAEPILAQDVATKNYVDEHSSNGEVVDVKINGNTILDSNKVANIELKNSLDNSTNNDIASALATKNAIDNVREVAEGKTNSYALFVSQNEQFKSNEEDIYVDSFVDISGNTIQVRDLKSGDVIYTVDSENNHYLDRFVILTGDNVLGAINADMPDLQNYYKKDESIIPSASGLNVGSGEKVFGTTYTQNLNDGVNSVSVDELANKKVVYELTYDGSHILNEEGQVVGFADIKALLDNKKYSVYIKDLTVNCILIFNSYDDNTLEFNGHYQNALRTLIIYDNNTIQEKDDVILNADFVSADNVNKILTVDGNINVGKNRPWSIIKNSSSHLLFSRDNQVKFGYYGDNFTVDGALKVGNNQIRSNSNDIIIKEIYNFTDTNFKGPGRDLGHPQSQWKDLYLSGNITDGTNSVSVAQISNAVTAGGGTKLYQHTILINGTTYPLKIVSASNTPVVMGPESTNRFLTLFEVFEKSPSGIFQNLASNYKTICVQAISEAAINLVNVDGTTYCEFNPMQEPTSITDTVEEL